MSRLSRCLLLVCVDLKLVPIISPTFSSFFSQPSAMKCVQHFLSILCLLKSREKLGPKPFFKSWQREAWNAGFASLPTQLLTLSHFGLTKGPISASSLKLGVFLNQRFSWWWPEGLNPRFIFAARSKLKTIPWNKMRICFRALSILSSSTAAPHSWGGRSDSSNWKTYCNSSLWS